jgi:uncharacterized protein CbrC (UPF0167 family)
MTLPTFRYHPDPLASGSIVTSDKKCRCCRKARGFIYAGPVYADDDLEEALCPWCIADGSAARKFDATFFDAEAVSDEVPEAAMNEICERTPGYDSWQGGHWPACCGDAARYLFPVGYPELQGPHREWQGSVLNHIIYNMSISGGAATRLLQSLHRDQGPTAYLFECASCGRHHVHVDHL